MIDAFGVLIKVLIGAFVLFMYIKWQFGRSKEGEAPSWKGKRALPLLLLGLSVIALLASLLVDRIYFGIAFSAVVILIILSALSMIALHRWK